MDPNAVWREIIASMQHYAQHRCKANGLQVLDRLESLTEWLRKGGFPPQLNTTFVFTERELELIHKSVDMASFLIASKEEHEQLLERLGKV